MKEHPSLGRKSRLRKIGISIAAIILAALFLGAYLETDDLRSTVRDLDRILEDAQKFKREFGLRLGCFQSVDSTTIGNPDLKAAMDSTVAQARVASSSL